MDVNTHGRVADDLFSSRTARLGVFLALPVRVAVIDPVIYVLILIRLALFVDRNQQDVRLLWG